jgi:hypothetical protein
MRTIMVPVDDDTYLNAETRARALGKSVSDVVANYLREWVSDDAIQQARESLKARFAKPDWQFSIGNHDDREQPNVRTRSLDRDTSGEIGQRYFDAIKQTWAPFLPRRIIPFCTPVMIRPTALVIGTNHSDFVRGGGPEADSIADALSRCVPSFSTFLEHSHTFAEGLRAVCDRAGLTIDQTWMGTNRCAVQTGPKGLDEIKSMPQFMSCQRSMDAILTELIDAVAPINLILAGRFACELFYPKGLTIEQLSARDQTTSDRSRVRIIPIPHWSRATFWALAAERLRQHFVKH